VHEVGLGDRERTAATLEASISGRQQQQRRSSNSPSGTSNSSSMPCALLCGTSSST
jgi:hypothetical protein